MSTAAEFRQRYSAPKPIIVKAPDSDLEITCKIPDLVEKVMSGMMEWPALSRVRQYAEEHATPADGTVDNRPLPTLIDRAQALGDVFDEWTCIAAVSPKVVMTEYEEIDAGTVWVERLPYPLKLAVFNATFGKTKTARADFRDDEPAGPTPGPSSEAVRPAALELAGDQG